MTQSFCGNCGTGLPHGANWCHGCGVAVAPTQAAPAPVQQPYAGQSPYEQAPYPQPHPVAVQGPYAAGAPQPPQPPGGSGPYGTAPYAGGPGAPRPGWGVLEGLLAGDWAGAARHAGFAVLAMLGVSFVGMLLVAGGELGFAETFVLILGGVCLAVGGDAFAESEARMLAYDYWEAGVEVSVGILPLTVTLVGVLVLGASFARRLRKREVTRGRDVLLHLVRTALVFTLPFLPLPLLTRYTADTSDDGLGDIVDVEGVLGVGVWSSLSGALLFAVAATGLVALFRSSAPLLGRLRPRMFPALMAALAVFVTGALAAVVFIIWALVENGGDDGTSQFLGVWVLAFVNGMAAAVLWTAGVPLTAEGGLASDISDSAGGSQTVSLLTFTDEHGAFWLAPVVLFVVMLCVAVVVVLRQHTILEARLEGLRFAAALGLVALGAALLLRIAVDSSAGGAGGFGSSASATATFNPFLAAFVLALWGAVTGLIAPAIAAGLSPQLVQRIRGRYGMAPAPAPVPPAATPPAPQQQWG